MKARRSLALVTADGSRVDLPLLPETLVRTRTAERSGERIEFAAVLDDRLGEGEAMTADTISALAALSGVGELHWGDRRFRGTLAELIVTETAFRDDLEPMAATVRIAFDIISDEGAAVSVIVAGARWRQVADLGSAGPDDRVYAVDLGDDGSMQIRFGDGKHGARPTSDEVLVQARYRVGGGHA